MSTRQTPTSKRSPSILVTDVRSQKNHSAPFVNRNRRLEDVSVDRLLSNTSEVPSAQRRIPPIRRQGRADTNSHSNQQSQDRTGQFGQFGPNGANGANGSNGHGQGHGLTSQGQYGQYGQNGQAVSGPKVHHRLVSQALPSRTSKQSQRLVLIPQDQDTDSIKAVQTELEQSLPEDNDYPRVTSYMVAEGFDLKKVAVYLKRFHRVRTRLYDEALFVDYLLPLLPGDDNEYRAQSSLGDNRTMERMIDISEQREYHFEYFSGQDQNPDSDKTAGSNDEFDPSEPQDFSPRPDHGMKGRDSHASDSHHNMNYHPSHDSKERMPVIDANVASGANEANGQSHDLPDGKEPRQSSSGNNSTDQNVHDHEHEHEHGSGNSNDSGSSRHAGSGSSHQPIKPHASEKGSHSDTELREARIRSYMSHAEMFIFSYGAVVFWNFTEGQEKGILADLCIGGHDLAIKPFGDQEIETEELQFYYTVGESERPRIFNDVVTLSSNNHMLKLALSHAAAQSTKLCIFEERMQTNMQNVKSVPKTLALTGKLGLNREQLLKISGKLFKLRVDVNLSSNVLDTPDFFWNSEPSLHPLYDALRQYLEIDQRILVVNERCGVFLELTSILADSIAEFNMDRITVIVIALIVLSICVSLTEIVIRFFLLRREAQLQPRLLESAARVLSQGLLDRAETAIAADGIP